MVFGYFYSRFSISDGESWLKRRRQWVSRSALPGLAESRPFAINSKKFGMWLFIVSDTLTFSALLLAYSYSRLSNPNWPRPFEIYPAIAKSTSMTLVLLASSLTMVLGVAAAHRNDRAKAVRWLLLTALGGLAFTVLHLTEWINLFHEGYTPWSTPQGVPLIWRDVFRNHRLAYDTR